MDNNNAVCYRASSKKIKKEVLQFPAGVGAAIGSSVRRIGSFRNNKTTTHKTKIDMGFLFVV